MEWKGRIKVQRVDGQTIDQAHKRVGDDSLALLFMLPGAIVYIGDLPGAALTWALVQRSVESDLPNFHKLRYR